MNLRRVFIGIEFDAQARRAARNVFKHLKRKHWPVVWQSLSNLHLTLVFLGSITDQQIDQVIKTAETITPNHQPFELKFKGLGAFPDLFLPTIIWLSVIGDLKSLSKVRKQFQNNLLKLEIDFDSNPFIPHVTLGKVSNTIRYKHRKQIGLEIQKLLTLDIPQALIIDHLTVFESLPCKHGSNFQTLRQIYF